jgi:cupin 2 domain-containing protein
MKANLLHPLPLNLASEVLEDIIRTDQLRIERIVSKGHCSPVSGWYDQDEHEWVLVVEGRAVLEFEQGVLQELSAGDYLNIPAHTKHKVRWTDPDTPTVWLAIFYR